MTYTAAEIAALDSGAYRTGIFFYMNTEPAVRLWMGFGAIDVPAVSAFDPDGEVYRGMGLLRDVPTGKRLLNGKAERVTFTLSGVNGDIFNATAAGDPLSFVRGKFVRVGSGLFSPDWKLLGIQPRAVYRADFVTMDQVAPEDPKQDWTRTIGLSCGTATTGRWRPGLSYFSNADQTTRYPGDRFCERVPIYANGFNKPWPQY